MEMALIQQSGLRSLHSIQASTSGPSHVVAGCEYLGLTFCKLSASGARGNSTSVWKLRRGRLSLNHDRRGTLCRSSGGTRRDDAKNVSRNQKRRSRHVKGVTPTKPDLLDELQAEEDADAQLDSFEADLESNVGGDTSNESEDIAADESEEEGTKLLEKPELKAELTQASNGQPKNDSEPNKDVNVERERWDQVSGTGASSPGSPGVEEIVERDDNTYTFKYYPGGKGGSKSAGQAANDTVKDVSSTAQDTADETQESLSKAGDTVQEGAEDVVDQVGEAAEKISDVNQDTAEDVTSIAQDTATDVSDTVQDTAEDVTSIAQEAADDAGKNLSEAGDAVQENVEEGSEQLGSAVSEVTDVAQETAEELTDVAQETAEDVGKSLEEAGEAVLETVEEVASEGQKAVQEGASDLRKQFEGAQAEAEDNFATFSSQAEEAGDQAGKAFEKVSDEAGKSLQTVQESLETLFKDSAKAVETVGSEAIRLGEVVLTAAGEATGLQGITQEQGTSSGTDSRQAVVEKPKVEASKSKKGSKSSATPEKQKSEGTKSKKSQPEESKEEDKNPYKGLKVTVAGASGRTGFLLVQELVSKGVPVRALVRDINKPESRDLGKFLNVEVVQADLYKYETIKKSLGDSNVVISAIGARSFPFDPIGTYQAEFEGVKNLVAAAKNKGDVKKFVFVTSLGVTFLQIIPLIFWKKQSELYLQRSGLDYTIVRPGGLTNGTNPREAISMKPADTQFGGAISRKKVAEVCVAALITPEASEKIVEIVSTRGSSRSYSDLFGSV